MALRRVLGACLARRVLAAAVASLAASCSAALSFDQCRTDDDCTRFRVDDQPAYCTSDRICVSDFPSDRICEVSAASSDDPSAVTIAGLFRRTGPNDVVDTALEHAVELAVQEINQQGARQLRLVLCDTGGDPAQARKALATASSRWHAVAGVGPTSSAEVVELALPDDSEVAKRNFLVVSCSSTAPRVGSLADDDLIWRTAASDTLQARVLVLPDLIAASTARVAAAYVNSTYGSGLEDAFVKRLGALAAPKPAISARGFDEGTPGGLVVNFLEAQAPDVALVVADSDAPAWIAGFNGAGATLATTSILLTDGSKAPALFSQGPTAAVMARVQGTAPATPSGPAFDAFKAVYQGTYGTDPSATAFVANAYDATYAIAIAMGAIPAGAPVTGRALVVGMQLLSDPTGMRVRVGPGEFGAAYQWLADGGTVDLDGTSGPIDFDPNTGDILTAPIEIWGVDIAKAQGGICGLDAMGNPMCPFTHVKTVTPPADSAPPSSG